MKTRALAAFFATLLSVPLFASSHVWTGAADGLFSNSANWAGGSPAGDAAAELTFPNGPAVTHLTNDISGLNLRAITFSGGGYEIAGTAMTFSAAAIRDTSARSNVIASDIILAGISTITAAEGFYPDNAALSFTGTISGSGGVTLDGEGRTIFGGTNANSYRDTTLVRAGELRLSKPPNVNAIGGPLILVQGDVSLAAGEQIPNDVSVTIGDDSTIRLGGNDETFGPLKMLGDSSITGGRVILGADVAVGGSGYTDVTIDAMLYLPASRAIRIAEAYHGFTARNVTAVPGATLTIDGGNVEIDGNWSGATILNDSDARILNRNTAVTLNGGSITGEARSLISNGGTVNLFDAAGDIRLDSRSVVMFRDDVPAVVAGGAVEIGGVLSIGAPLRHAGKTSVAVLNNGPEPVRGSFNAAPEGASIDDGLFTISYRGGDGNDVVLTDVSRLEPEMHVELSADEVRAGTAIAVIATITGHAQWDPPAPGGFITFREGTTIFSTEPLNGGQAAVSLAPLPPGRHEITIDYSGDSVWLPATQQVEVVVTHPLPEITSLSPSGGKAETILTFAVFGKNFVQGAQVISSPFLVSTEYISSTELRATIDLTRWHDAGTFEISVANPGPGSLYSNHLTLEIFPADPRPPTGMTLGATYAEVKVTPSATTAWLAVLWDYSRVPAAVSARYTTLIDTDGDGVVRWDIGVPIQTGEIIAVDMSSGQFTADGPRGGAEHLPFPDDIFDLGPNGKVSRLRLHQGRSEVLWVRPGAGAWFIEGEDGGSADSDRIEDMIFTTLTSSMRPVGGSPAPPDSFNPGDLLFVIDGLQFRWFGGAIGTHLQPSTAAPTLTIGTNFMVTEGDALRFSIERRGRADGVTTVHYATKDIQSVAGLDYPAASGLVTFNPGEFVKTITVPTIDDHVYAGRRELSFVISDASGATIKQDSVRAFILDNDSRPFVGAPDVSVPEGGAGMHHVQVPFTLTGVTRLPVSVSWQAGPESSGTLFFAPGETSKTADVLFEGNDTPERDRVIAISLSTSFDADVPDRFPRLTIIDDDLPRVSIDDVTVKEGDSGTTTATFNVTLDIRAPRPVTISWATADGTATAGADYLAASGTLTFAPDEQEKTIDVAVIGDAAKEGNELFVVNLSGAALSRSAGVVTILEDDPPVPPSLSIADVRVREADQAIFIVELSAPSASTVLVDYQTVAATASAEDFYSAAGTITFDPGETQRAIDVYLIGDLVAEPDETFRVVLANPRNATIERGEAIGTIVDDDLTSAPSLSVGDVTVQEGTTVATFIVTLSAAATQAVTVSYSTVDAGATSPADYIGTRGDLRFEPGETTKTISVIVNGDGISEGTEEFAVVLSNALGATLGSAAGRGVIVDDDPVPTSPRGRPSRH